MRYTLAILLFLPLHLLAQDNESNVAIQDYINRADKLWHTNTQAAIKYADSAYAKVKGVKKPQLKVDILATQGIAQYTLGNYKKAEQLYLEAYWLAIAEKLDADLYYRYYLTLLLRKGRSAEVIRKVDSILASTNDYNQTSLLLNKASAAVELGEKELLRKTINEIGLISSDDDDQLSLQKLHSKYQALDGNYDSAYSLLQTLLEKPNVAKDSLEKASILNEIGRIEILRSHYDQALYKIAEARQLYTAASYNYGVAKSYYLLGSLYAELGNIELAVENYYKAEEIFKIQSNKKELAEVYHELAWMYFNQNKDRAYELLQQSLSLAQEIDNDYIVGTVYNYLGTYYSLIDTKYDSAIYAFNRSIDVRASLAYAKGRAAAEFNLGTVYEELGNYPKALELYLRSNPIDEKIGNVLGYSIGNYTIGNLYTKMGQFDKAYEYLKKAETDLIKINARLNLVECYLYLSRYYEETNNLEMALEYYKKHTKLKDDVYSSEKEMRIAELEARYTLSEKDREIRLLNLENENRLQSMQLQQKTISNQRFFLAIISVVVLLIIVLLIFSYRLIRNKNRANKALELLNREISEKTEEITAQSEELQEANEEIVSLNDGLERMVQKRTQELKEAHKDLDTFFYHAAHDFRRPLTTFLGLAEIGKTIFDDPKALELFDKVRETAGSLDRMVTKLRAVNVVGFEKITKKKIKIDKVLENVVNKHESIIIDRGILIEPNLDITEIKTSREVIEIILDNLVENSILFSNPRVKSYVRIKTTQSSQDLVISVSDNGQGINEEVQEKIFDMYYRGNEGSQGNGLGLYITKKAVEKLNGTLEFNTKLGEGSEFIVRLPILK